MLGHDQWCRVGFLTIVPFLFSDILRVAVLFVVPSLSLWLVAYVR